MNILLVRPRPDRRSVNQWLMTPEPLELEIVAGHLQSLGHAVDVVDLVLERRPLTSFVKQKPYDFVGLTGYLNHVQVVKQLARDVKRVSPRTAVVVGGVHAEIAPTDFVDPAIDHVLWANGALTLGTLASGLTATEAACLPGVWGSGKPRPAPLHPAGMLPDRTVTAKYRDRYTCMHSHPSATLRTTYGGSAQNGDTGSSPSPERDLDEVMDELEAIEESHVIIVDDDFLERSTGVAAFCQALDARGIAKHFVAFARPDQVGERPDDVRLLAEHGFDAIVLSLDPVVATDLEPQHDFPSVDANARAMRVLEDAGVQCFSDLFTGSDWRPEDFDNVIDFLNGLESPMVSIQPETPMPWSPPLGTVHPRTVGQGRHERSDTASLRFEPSAMGPRMYYWHLLRANYKTSANPARRQYVKQRYGKRLYRRMLRGTVGNTWQYVKLLVRPG